jgi:hypothetical protein
MVSILDKDWEDDWLVSFGEETGTRTKRKKK